MKKTLILALLVATTVSTMSMTGCGSTSQKSAKITNGTDVSQSKEVETTNTSAESGNLLGSYAGLKKLGKEHTTTISNIMKKYNMESITTKDGMYTGNKDKSYKINDTAYRLNIAYIYKPDFSTGHGQELAYVKYEIPSNQSYKSTDNNIKLISEILKELGNEEESIVTSQGSHEAEAYNNPGQSNEMHFGTGNRGTFTMTYDSQYKRFAYELTYVTGFENFTIQDTKATYNTVADFNADTKMDNKIKELAKKYNFTHTDGDQYDYINTANDIKMNIQADNKTTPQSNSMNKEFFIQMPFGSNGIADKDTDAFKTMYESLKEFGVTNKMTETDMLDYISSLAVYADNQKGCIASLPLTYYMPPVANIATSDYKKDISINYTGNGPLYYPELRMVFDIPVTIKGN
jgi:hypothetical protein